MTVRFTSLTATPSTTGTLKVGDSVTYTAVVNQPVEVTGLPLLILNVPNVAVYDAVLSDPASGRLIFHYAVRPGDVTGQLLVLGLSQVGSTISSPGSMFFNNPTNYAAGNHPTAIATADLNGDGIPDLVTTSYADGTVFQHLFEHLTAFAPFCTVGHENRVIVQECTVAHRSTGDMGSRIVIGEVDDSLIPGQHTVGGDSEAFEQAFGTKTGENMRRNAAVVIATLRADMVEARTIGHVDLHHHIQPCSAGSILQQRQFGTGGELDKMVEDRVGSC